MQKLFLLIILLLVSVFITGFSQETAADAATTVGDTQEPAAPAAQEDSLLRFLFISGQFGGGSMITLGGGFGFFDDIVRAEGLFGYTPDGNYKDLSIMFKLNARILRLEIIPEFAICGTIGSTFTFYSNTVAVTSALFVAEEFDVRRVLFFPVVSLYCEQNLYFVATKEGNMLFQLAIGLKVHPF